MKIQFGCGSNKLEGWQNHDSDVDFTQRLPYRDGVADTVLIEHALEHCDSAQGFAFMEEALRILKPGGVLRICVPMLERIKDVAHCRDLILHHGHQCIYSRETLITALQVAGFDTVTETARKECDGHWRVIGEAKDELETLRVEARKKCDS